MGGASANAQSERVHCSVPNSFPTGQLQEHSTAKHAGWQVMQGKRRGKGKARQGQDRAGRMISRRRPWAGLGEIKID